MSQSGKAVSVWAVIGCIVAAAAQEAPPAVVENAAPPEKTEFKTPESTVGMLRLAIIKGDAAAMKECYYNGDLAAAVCMEEYCDNVIAMRLLSKLAAEKFKDDQACAAFAKTVSQLADIAEFSKIEIDGDTAKGPSAKNEKQLITFRKINGKWKIDSIATLGISDETRSHFDAMAPQTRVFNQARAELNEGKFKSFQEMRERLAALMAEEKKRK